MAQDIDFQKDNKTKSLEEDSKDDAQNADYHPIRITVPFTKVLSTFVSHSKQQYSGADICRQTGLKSGTVYPMLLKMAENGWLKDEWEKVDPKKVGRPKRRMYLLTEKGYSQGHKILIKHFPNLTVQSEQPFEADLVPVY